MAVNELLLPFAIFSVLLLLSVFLIIQFLSIRRTNHQLIQLKDDYSSLQSQFLVAQKVSKGMGNKLNELQLENRKLKTVIEELRVAPTPVQETPKKPTLNTELFDNPEHDLKSLMGKSAITH
jgi:hypothetical protein